MMKNLSTKQRGYSVYKRSDSGAYGVRFSIKGHKQFRFGLGKVSEDEAYMLAERKYLETKILAEKNMLGHEASFVELAKQYVEDQFLIAERNPKKMNHAKHAKSTVERYYARYFEDYKITEIYHADLLDYLDWRRVFWTEGDGKDIDYTYAERGGKRLKIKARHKEATASTLRREASFLRGVFKLAVRKRLLKQGDVPKLELPKVFVTKRPSFTKDEYHNLLLISEQRIAEAVGNQKLMYERMLLHCFMTIAAETGMRPGELFNLNWGHIEGLDKALTTDMDKRSITIMAYGKGKPPQRIVPKRSAITGFEMLRDACKTQFDSFPSKTDPVFRNFYGKRIGSLNFSLNRLLEAADVMFDAMGDKRSTYSFRHSYATW
jgi:integrase